MKQKRLVLQFDTDIDRDGRKELEITPLIIPLKGEWQERIAEELARIADALDKVPGDGKFEYTTSIKVPVIKLLNLNKTIDETVRIYVEEVEVPD
jgi:hypothetical protein